MNRLRAALVLAAILIPSLPAHATSYAVGSFCSTCNNATSLNQFYDDGLHGDGAAGDGVFGATVVSDVAAGAYDWFSGNPSTFAPGLPYCWCAFNFTGNAHVYTTGPGDVLHFTLDQRSLPNWVPGPSIATDHDRPSSGPITVGIDFDMNDPIWSPPHVTAPTAQSGSIHEAIVLIPVAGYHAYAFFGGVTFSLAYNGYCGSSCFPGENPVASFTTADPNSYVQLRLDRSNGRMRADVLGTTPNQPTSWGSLKTLYR